MDLPQLGDMNNYREISYAQINELKRFSNAISEIGYEVLKSNQKPLHDLRGTITKINESLQKTRSFGRWLLDLITLQFIKRIVLSHTLPGIKTSLTILGPLAFKVRKDNDIPTFKKLTEYEFANVLKRYPHKFKGNHPHNKTKTVHSLVYQAYFEGTFHAAANPVYGNYQWEIKLMMGLIINELGKSYKTVTEKQKSIADRLDIAFNSCQAEQFRTIQSITLELLSRGDLAEAVSALWQDYKMIKLDEIIGERHPNSTDPKQKDFKKQFPHIKSAYIENLGEQFGLNGVDAARLDIHRPQDLSYPQSLRNDFKSRLNLDEFARQIALDINNHNQETSTLDKTLVFKWINAGGTPGFGFYRNDKVYTDMAKPTEAQEDLYAPYMTVDEAMALLAHPKVGIAF